MIDIFKKKELHSKPSPGDKTQVKTAWRKWVKQYQQENNIIQKPIEAH